MGCLASPIPGIHDKLAVQLPVVDRSLWNFTLSDFRTLCTGI